MEELDNIDIKILWILQQDSKKTTKEIAQEIGLSTTPVFERIKRLEKEGYIKKYIAILDPQKTGNGFIVFCNVKLIQHNTQIAIEFTKAIQDIPQVTECYNVSGEFDYLLKIYAPNMKYYQEFIINVLGHIQQVGSIQSMFVMEEIKHSQALVDISILNKK